MWGLRRARAVACWTLLSLAAQPVAAKDTDLKGETSRLVSALLQHARLTGKRIAVGEFPDGESKTTGLSVALAENVELSLLSRAEVDGFKLVDRRNVGELAKEWDLSVSGAVDDSAITRAGHMLGADVLCIGKYARAGRKASVRVSLVSAEKGEILAAETAEIYLDSTLRDLSETIPRPAPPPTPAETKDPLKVEITAEKTAYAVGEKATLRVTVNHDCYLTVIDVGADGVATVLFPNLYAQNNAVKGGSTVLLPDPAAGFEWEVAAPAGVDVIRAIASKEPSVDLADVMSRPTSGEPFALVKEDLAVATRAIRVKAKKAKPGEWAESVFKLTIKPSK